MSTRKSRRINKGRKRNPKPRKSRRTRKSKQRQNPKQPKIGDSVEIIIKPYHHKVTKKGIVKRVLTKKKFHSRGHKVMLSDGTVGRIVNIF